MPKIVQDSAEPNPVGVSLLDEIVRDGDRQMLAAALLAEVAGYVALLTCGGFGRVLRL